MDYEKAYKELIEKIELISHSALTIEQHQIVDTILEEFKESEDEKIRKELLKFLEGIWHLGKNAPFEKWDKSDCSKWIAWLEKQGEAYTKRDVDNAYLEGMAFAKDELEKQAEVVSDNDDIEAEEKGIRKAFNKIWEEKQDKQKSQRMISAEAKEAMYDKPADTVGLKCEESKTKIFDAPTPFEDKLYAFVLACEILVDPSKREFILEHSQEILDAAKEQIEKERESAWSEDDELVVEDIEEAIINYWHGQSQEDLLDWLKSLKTRYTWKPSDEQIEILDMVLTNESLDDNIARILRELREQLKKLREE